MSGTYRFVIVGCGSAKRDRELVPGTLRVKRYPARDLYTSNWVQLNLEYAETIGDEAAILSAEHGLIDPGKEIEPYETSIGDLDADDLDALADDVRSFLVEWINWDRTPDRVDVLAGKRYLDPLRERGAFDVEPPVRFPLQEHDLGGIGEQMAWVKEQVEDRQQPRLATDGGVVAPLTVPDQLPRSLGEYDLVERSDERTVWRRTWTAIAGEYKTEILVFQQYGGWRVKRHYNQNLTTGSPGGYRYVDKSESRATFDDRQEAERRAVEVLRERVDALVENRSVEPESETDDDLVTGGGTQSGGTFRSGGGR